MFNHVLVGIDGGPGGHDAIALAGRLAAPGARLTLVHVWSTARGVFCAATGVEHPSVAAEALLSHTRLQEALDCAVVHHGATSTGAGLHHVVESTGADLLVVGSGGPDGEHGTATVSGDVRGALHGAGCALAVAPVGFAGAARAIQTVGVASTATPVGAAAVRSARALAAGFGATVHGLTVIPLMPSAWVGGPVASFAVLEDITGTSLRRAREALEELGVVPHAVSGLPAVEILRFSKTVDLLVLGSRGYGPVRRLLFGSTSTQVLAGKARCPVLVVPLANGLTGGAPDATGAREPAATG